MESNRSARLLAGGRRTLFVVLAASIMGVGSERVFWFWSTAPLDHLVVAAMYSVPVGLVMWTLTRYRVTDVRSLLLVLPLAGLVTEGVLTPVVYSGGPFVPVFPAWFAYWHGIFSLGVLLFAVRAWLLRRRWVPLVLTALATGLFWGAWSATSWLPENRTDPELVDAYGTLEILDPVSFARYVTTFTIVLAVSHWLIGYVWPTTFAPRRLTVRLWAAGLGLAVAAWTVAVPWALPMFAVYGGVQRWGLRRHERVASGPELLGRLTGRVRPVDLLALAPLPLAAALAYGAVWRLDPSDTALRRFMYLVIAVQASTGFVVSVLALRRSGTPRGAAMSTEAGPVREPTRPVP